MCVNWIKVAPDNVQLWVLVNKASYSVKDRLFLDLLS